MTQSIGEHVRTGIILFCLCLISATIRATEPTREQQFCEKWQSFRGNPNPETAMVLEALLADSLDAGAIWADTTCWEDVENDLSVLENEITAGERYAVSLAMSMVKLSDGAATEYLFGMIGHSARQDPEYFLQALARHRTATPQLDDAVTFVGGWFSDMPQFNRGELRGRLRAIAFVDNPELIELRDNCIRMLEEALGETD